MAVSLRASREGLKKVDAARRKKGWTKAEDAWWGLAPTSKATLKRFWRSIPIEREAFIAICENVGVNWEEIVDETPPSPDSSTVKFFSYDNIWVGREDLIAELSTKVKESCRLLILVGLSGIGKTALAEKLAVELQKEFLQGDWSKFHQENLENTEARDFRSVASRWLKKWGESLTPDDFKDVNRLLYRLVYRLRKHRYLIIIDSLENILVGNEDQGWNNFEDKLWVKFWELFLASPECQSRIILTSQDLPEEIPGRYQNFWEHKVLTGLSKSEQLQLFGKTGLEVEENSVNLPYLQSIGNAYEGHPLALRVIAGEIYHKFNGNVVAYWKKHGKEIEEVEKAIEEGRTQGVTVGADDKFQLDRYTRMWLWRTNVSQRLDKTFLRLQKDAVNAYRLICVGAIYRCEVPESFWLKLLKTWQCDEEKQEAALQTLRDRFLVEDVGVDESGEFLFRQHNLIRSVSLERLKKLDEEDGYTENNTQGGVILPSAESVLELLNLDPDSLMSIKPLSKRLQYQAVVIWLSDYKCPQKVNDNLEVVKGYLEAFYHLCEVGDWERAKQIYSIKVPPVDEDLDIQLRMWGCYKECIQLYSRLLGKLDQYWDGICLNGLGNVYHSQGEYDKAMEYYQQRLQIAQEIGDRSGEGNSLGNLGNVYNSQGEYDKAMEYYQQSLQIAQEICDRSGEGRALGNLGETLFKLEKYAASLEYSQAALEIFKQIENPHHQGIVLINVAEAHQHLGNLDAARQYCDEALAILTELGAPELKECQELRDKLG